MAACPCCGESHEVATATGAEAPHPHTDAVQVVIVWAPGLSSKAANITPAESYTFCRICTTAAYHFVDRAVDASVFLRAIASHKWTRAIIVCEDGRGYDLKAIRQQVASA